MFRGLFFCGRNVVPIPARFLCFIRKDDLVGTKTYPTFGQDLENFTNSPSVFHRKEVILCLNLRFVLHIPGAGSLQ